MLEMLHFYLIHIPLPQNMSWILQILNVKYTITEFDEINMRAWSI